MFLQTSSAHRGSTNTPVILPDVIYLTTNLYYIWGLVCQKQVSRAWTSNYIPYYLWDVITCPCPSFISASGTHFTNDFSITIQIRWKFHLALIQVLVIISQQNLAHATTAQLSCHVPNIVAITLLVFGWEQNEISITFELWWKNC